jgi:VIT1/CCC1 family predicted Fe2+/Mn2+ transporter
MITAKPWYFSKTIWAAIVTIVTSIAGLFGLPYGLIDNGALADAIIQGITALMGMVAIVGRVKAKAKIA